MEIIDEVSANIGEFAEKVRHSVGIMEKALSKYR